jgi:hypothetical protein
MSFVRGSVVVGFFAGAVSVFAGITSSACSWGHCGEDWSRDEHLCRDNGGTWQCESATCVGERPYDPTSSSASPPSEACSSDRDCPAGHCIGGACLEEECVSDLDCRAEAGCWARGDGHAFCRLSCAGEGACPPGLACQSGLCVEVLLPCDDAGACPDGLACNADAACVARCYGTTGSDVACSPPMTCAIREGDAGWRCGLVDHGACAHDDECRIVEGASCSDHRCFGPRPRARDAG